MPLSKPFIVGIFILLLSPASVCLGGLLDIVDLEEVGSTEAESYPWRAIGVLAFDDKPPHCTAFLTGPDEIRTNTHCVIDSTTGTIYPIIRFILYPHSPTDNRSIRVKTDNAVYDRHRQQEQNGEKPESPLDLGRMDYAILTLKESIGDEIGYFGISYPPTTHRPGKIRPGFLGAEPSRIDPCSGSCRYDEDPLSNYLAELKNEQQIRKGARGKKDFDDRPKSCMAGFPNVSWPSKMLRSRDCGLSGLGTGAPAHNCESDRGGSGSPLFVINRQCQAIAFAIHTGTRKTTIYYAPHGTDQTIEITYFNYNRSVLMSDENPDPELESILIKNGSATPNQ
ncbi:MAG: hypothetical protein C0616_03240 [Desulfuromonas sp.]|nr:MAG: hypothetical protein C0616_03240 [Desulfuromonas sp.]